MHNRLTHRSRLAQPSDCQVVIFRSPAVASCSRTATGVAGLQELADAPVFTVLQRLAGSPRGLTEAEAEAEERLLRFGQNEPPRVDLVVLQAGDVVPADLRVVSASAHPLWRAHLLERLRLRHAKSWL